MTPCDKPDDAHQASRDFNRACYQGFFNLALDLLSQGADPLWSGESGKSGAHYAAMGGHTDLCLFLAQQHPRCLDIRDHGGMTPLHLACRNSRAAAALALARGGAPLRARDDFGRMPSECCPDDRLRDDLAQIEIEMATTLMGSMALDRALSAPSIRNFL